MVKLDKIFKKETLERATDKDFVMETLTDEILEPHVHLTLLLLIVIIISVIIAILGI